MRKRWEMSVAGATCTGAFYGSISSCWPLLRPTRMQCQMQCFRALSLALWLSPLFLSFLCRICFGHLLPLHMYVCCPGNSGTRVLALRSPLTRLMASAPHFPLPVGLGSRDSTFLSAKHSFSTQEFNRQSFRIKCAPTPPLGRCGVTHR